VNLQASVATTIQINKGKYRMKVLFRSVLVLLSFFWGCVLFSGGQLKVISWWFVMFFGLAGILLLLLAIALLLKRAYQRKKTEKVLVGLFILSLLAAWPAGWFVGVGKIAFPANKDKAKLVISVRLPVNESVRIGWGGDSLGVNYHVFVPAERWAYDLIGQPATINSSNLNDYGIYGMEVVAPASGMVISIQNDKVDLTPGIELESGDTKEMLGNYVFIQLDETQTYLVIAHLMQGSILVKSGQHITEGTPIAQVGNSGSSSEPHLHIHHQRQDPSETSIFLTEGLPLYFRDIDGPQMPTGGISIENDKEVPIGQIVTPLNP
jgi:hypothetical protein